MDFKPSKYFQINSRGQAALVDSMFFIAIISAVCTGLFYFAINYGNSTDSLLNSFYSSDFAMDSLKVITYINLYRDGTAVSPTTTAANAIPVDYLLAIIKEDFAKNQAITTSTKTAIANTLHSALKPFDSSIDYIYYIAKESDTVGNNRFITMIISTRKCTDGVGGSVCTNSTDESHRVISRVYYSCNPTLPNAIEKYIFPYSGKVDSAIGKISLPEAGGYSYYVTGLYLWVAKKITALDDIINKSDPSLPSNQREANFNCELLQTS